jgi:hypothetical protein
MSARSTGSDIKIGAGKTTTIAAMLNLWDRSRAPRAQNARPAAGPDSAARIVGLFVLLLGLSVNVFLPAVAHAAGSNYFEFDRKLPERDGPIEIDFDAAFLKSLPPKEWYELHGDFAFQCDSVTIEGIRIKKHSDTHFTIETRLGVRLGVDKLGAAIYELRDGAATIGTTVEAADNLDEGRVTSLHSKLSVKSGELAALTAPVLHLHLDLED